MPGKAKHSDKWDRCFQKVQAQGHSKESAAAICTAALGEESYNEAHEEEEVSARDVHLVAAAGKIRTGQKSGREHIVMPLTALVEGVLHAVNSQYPELVLAEEFALSQSGWNGRPVMMNHPEKDGRKVSANTPGVLDESQLGQVFHSKANGRALEMEAWIDPEMARQVPEGERLLERIQAADPNDPIEVSVGVFMVAEHTEGNYNGKPYKAIWRRIVPDHLAILSEGKTGACSVAMGCGVRYMASAEEGYRELAPLPDNAQIETEKKCAKCGRKLTAKEKGPLCSECQQMRSAGGKGSGNFGHKGRPGEVGGSGGGGNGVIYNSHGQIVKVTVPDDSPGSPTGKKSFSGVVYNRHGKPTPVIVPSGSESEAAHPTHPLPDTHKDGSAVYGYHDHNGEPQTISVQRRPDGSYHGAAKNFDTEAKSATEMRGKLQQMKAKYSGWETHRTAGGQGSGNFGHAGRPGEVGGSGGGDGPYARPQEVKVSSVKEAIPLILAGKVVSLKNPKKVNTLLDKLAAIAKDAEKKGQKAPNYDACKITVRGVSFFCHSAIATKEYPQGIPRVAMPQLKTVPVPGSPADKLPKDEQGRADASGLFLDHLKKLGIPYAEEKVRSESIMASQRELNGPQIAKRIAKKDWSPSGPIYISRDNYIVDGHHKWAASVGRDAKDGKLGDSKVKVIRIDAPITEILHEAVRWTRKQGLVGKAATPRAAEEKKGMSQIKEFFEGIRTLAAKFAVSDERQAQNADGSDDAADEAAELMQYQTMEMLLSQCGNLYDECMTVIKDLVSAEQNEGTDTDEEAEETMETAQLSTVKQYCISMIGMLSSIASIATDMNAEELQERVRPMYMEAKQKLAAAEGCHCHDKEREEDVTKTERIKALAANEFNPRPFNDPEFLKTAPEEVLKALEDNASTRKKEKEAVDLKAAEEKKAAEVKTLSPEDWMSQAPPEIRDMVARHQAADAKAKSDLVAKLKTAQKVLTEEQLKARSLEQLQEIAALAATNAPVNYAGRGPQEPVAAEDDYMRQPPPDGYKIALEKQKAH